MATDWAAQGEANEFLVERLLGQAEREGASYSEQELHMLRWPMCGHTIEEDEAIDEKWAAANPGERMFPALYHRVADHLHRAYMHDRRNGVGSEQRYQASYDALQGSMFLTGLFSTGSLRALSIVQACRLVWAYDFTSAMLALVVPSYVAAAFGPPARVIITGLLIEASVAILLIVAVLYAWLR